MKFDTFEQGFRNTLCMKHCSISCTHKFLSSPQGDVCSWVSSQTLLLCFFRNNPVLSKSTSPLFLWKSFWWHVYFSNLKKDTSFVKYFQLVFIVKEILQHRFLHNRFIFESVELTHLYVSGISRWSVHVIDISSLLNKEFYFLLLTEF